MIGSAGQVTEQEREAMETAATSAHYGTSRRLGVEHYGEDPGPWDELTDQWREDVLTIVRATIAAAEPAIRADEREACAKIAYQYRAQEEMGEIIAAAIRAIKDPT